MSRVLGILMMGVPFAAALAALPPSAPTHGVRLEHTWIPLSDGTRLAVTLYMPSGSKPGERYPALLEYLPYRKDDDEAVRDFGTHTYFAKRGYVGARVDIRGFGMSEGSPPTANIRHRNSKTPKRLFRGSRVSLGRTATSACWESPGEDSIPYKWR